MRSLRVLLSIHHALDSDTGAPGSTLALGGALEGLGHEVEYLSFDDMPISEPYVAANAAYPFFAAARFAAARRRRGVDVIDASTGDAWVWGSLDRRRRRPLLVTRSHGLEHLFHAATVARAERDGERLSRRYPLYWGGWRLREVAASLRRSNLVLLLNEAEREYAVERLGVAPERVRLTANGVPDSFLAAAAAAETGGPGVAMVGAYREMKGVVPGSAALVEAMRADPELRASFIGAGVPAATVLERFPAELRERVAVVERYAREELPQLVRGHSILLFPTFSEGFSLALIEAMACGLVPVASDIPAVSRVVEEGRNGLLAPVGEAAPLAAAILRLRGDAATLQRLAQGARDTARAYSWPRVARRTSDLYEEALDLRRLP